MKPSITFDYKITNNINNHPLLYNKIKLNQYNNYQPNKNKTKSKNKKIILNPTNNNNENINKYLNNSAINISFKIDEKTNRESNSLHKNNKIIIFNKDLSLDKRINFYRNNNNLKNNLSNLNNSLNKTSFDFFKKRMNYFNSKFNIKCKNKIKPLKSLSKINKRNKSINDIKESKLYKKDIIIKIDKSKSSKRATPILASQISKSNSKNRNNIYNNHLFYLKSNLNINNIVKKNHNLKHIIRNKIFQSNNIFSQFKPKKKSETIIHREILQMNRMESDDKNHITIKNKEKNNNIKNKNISSNSFIEIHPKIIQEGKEKTNKLAYEESNK